jgi:hypothetical protein
MESDVPRDSDLRGWRKPGGPRAWLQVVRRLGGRFNLGLPVPAGDEKSCQCRSSMIRAGPTPSHWQVEGARRLQGFVGSCVMGADVLPKTADSEELGSDVLRDESYLVAVSGWCCRRGTSVPLLAIDMEPDVPQDLRGWRKSGGSHRAWLQVVRRLGGRLPMGPGMGDASEESCRSSMTRAGPTPGQVEGARRLHVPVRSCGPWALMCCRKRPGNSDLFGQAP